MSNRDLAGRTIRFEYESETYQVEVLDSTSLRWVQLKGPDEGKGATETYVQSQLSEETTLVTWVEADGLGLSNALNFTDMTVTTHANMGREVFVNTGVLVEIAMS